MNKYFAIKNEQGRYLKRDGGWCDDLKGATYGTEAQMRGMIEQKKNSPFYKGMNLEPLGEAMSGWMAKQDTLKGVLGELAASKCNEIIKGGEL